MVFFLFFSFHNKLIIYNLHTNKKCYSVKKCRRTQNWLPLLMASPAASAPCAASKTPQHLPGLPLQT